MVQRVAVVTGGNKGIGLAIVKGLCERFNGDVYLTSRDVSRGWSAIQELNRFGLNPHYHQLDVTDRKSLKKFFEFIKIKYGGIDILVNNAAIAFGRDSDVSPVDQAEQTIFINYFGLVSTCDILFPLMRPRGRVINVSSALGHLSFITGDKIKKKFTDKSLTDFKLDKLMKEYVKAVRQGTSEEDGWGSNSYAVSKVAVTALTFIHHKMYHSKGISINCYHPGYVDTDMTKHKGPMTAEQGAETALFLATNAPLSLSGKYLWYDKSIVDWYGPLPSELYISQTPVTLPAAVDEPSVEKLPPVNSLPANVEEDLPPMNSLPANIEEESLPPVISLPADVEKDLPPVNSLPANVEEDLPPVNSLPANVEESLPLVNALPANVEDELPPPNSLPANVEDELPPPNSLPANVEEDIPTKSLPADVKEENLPPLNSLPANVDNELPPQNSLPANVEEDIPPKSLPADVEEQSLPPFNSLPANVEDELPPPISLPVNLDENIVTTPNTLPAKVDEDILPPPGSEPTESKANVPFHNSLLATNHDEEFKNSLSPIEPLPGDIIEVPDNKVSSEPVAMLVANHIPLENGVKSVTSLGDDSELSSARLVRDLTAQK